MERNTLTVWMIIAVLWQGAWSCPWPCTCHHNIKGEVTVDCSNKNLTSVPQDIPITTQHLDLKHNNITILENNTFLELSLLRDLDLSFNSLTQLERSALHGLGSLERLYLASNHLHLNNDSYPVGVFSELTKLQVLDIQNNTDDATLARATNYPDLTGLVALRVFRSDSIFTLHFGKAFQTVVNLQELDFSGFAGYCYMYNITENMFENINTSHPLKLNISECGIAHIHPRAFNALPTLEVLDLTDNGRFRFPNLMIASESFINTSLKVLMVNTINRGEFMTLYGQYFQHLRKTRLTSLTLDHNWVTCLDERAMLNLPRTIRYLSIKGNKLIDANFLLGIILLPNIEFLDMGHQVINSRTEKRKTFSMAKLSTTSEYCHSGTIHTGIDSPRTIKPTRHKADRAIEYFNMSSDSKGPCDDDDDVDAMYGYGIHIVIIPLPPTLHTLRADFIRLGYTLPNLTFTSSNSLRSLNMSTDILYCWGGPWYGLHDLELFDLSSNQCNDVSPIFFKDMANLTHLYLHDNNLGWSLALDGQGEIFSSQANLQILTLSKNRIRQLPKTVFRNLVNLEQLKLDENSLNKLGARIGHMTKLKYLDLSRNELVTLDTHMLQDLDEIAAFTNITIDISDNPSLECNCGNLEFVTWSLRTNVRIRSVRNNLCFIRNGSFIPYEQFDNMARSLWFTCNGQTLFTIVLSLFIVVLFILAMASVVYYKRWKLRYLYYTGRRRLNPFYPTDYIASFNRLRDVFVSYDEDDITWRQFVQGELLDKFKENNISCLISEVDFLSGRSTREIIEHAVLGSKKTLALITSDFFESRDRELEFNMAVMHGMETRQAVVIPVAMEVLDEESLPPEVAVFLEAYPCLPYTGDEAFWEELVRRIKHDDHANVHS
ncbi:toll-like receptor 4 [Haliotis rubra]|uniref:toll-like receptor 4 n=1 Tax=Haliotis rubra TaxID=36100 RepID=UPI001EE5A80E|nr:toll-like receptor 4 [Haliotis rubra]XP_046570338.1 toll-like receptor 4 [Haliotis rubra]